MQFISTYRASLQWLQYRTNQNILTTNSTSIMYKIGKVYSRLCNFCYNEEETIYHLMWNCQTVQQLLIDIKTESKCFIFEKQNGINNTFERWLSILT